MPTRFRKRPIEVEAIQWTGDNEAELSAFAGSNFEAVDPEDRDDDPDMTGSIYDKLHSTWVKVYTGQWVVKGVRGEFYPIAPDVLAETYDKADACPPGGYGPAWTELRGYVQEAVDDGGPIDPPTLLTFMDELKRRALAPVRAWMAERAGGGVSDG